MSTNLIVDPAGGSSVNLELPPQIHSLRIFRNDIWRFLADAVWTLDPTDKVQPVKKYPDDSSPKSEYLKLVANRMAEETLYCCVKHRRMIVTWTGCAMILWDAMFREGRFNAIVAAKEENSDELVRRCKFIYENIPKSVLPFKPDLQYKYTELRFSEIDSTIKGFAQGTDQLRQFGCSRIFGDEVGIWSHPRQAFTAMKPTLEGGGKVTLVSTRRPGFFQQLVEDTLDD